MKKRLLGLALMVMALVAVLTLGVSAAWDGSSDISWYDKDSTSFTIDTKEELAGLAAIVNGTASGILADTFADKTVTLGASLDLSNYEWTPIGTSENSFQGTFDGGNKTISNLVIHQDSGTHYGLFGKTVGAKLQNVIIANVTIDIETADYTYAGALAGQAYTGTVSNCHVKGLIDINAYWFVGGLSGHGYAEVTGCSVHGDEGSVISGDINPGGSNYHGVWVGGLWGYRAEGNLLLDDCHVSGVTVYGGYYVGGISGGAYYGNIFSNCSVDSVTVEAVISHVGSIAGRNITSNDYGTLKMLDNTVTNTTCTLVGETVVQQTTPGGVNWIVGSDVEYDSDGYIIGGTFEYVSESFIASGYELVDGVVSRIPVSYEVTSYQELNTAIASAASGDIIYITDDITVPSTYASYTGLSAFTRIDDKDLTIIGKKSDGTAPTITDERESGSSLYLFSLGNTCESDFKLENLNFDLKHNISVALKIASTHDMGTLELIDITINGGSSAIFIGKDTDSYIKELVMDNVKITDTTSYAAYLGVNLRDADITDCTFTNSGKGFRVSAPNESELADINITKCTFDGATLTINQTRDADLASNNGTVNISGCTFTGTQDIILDISTKYTSDIQTITAPVTVTSESYLVYANTIQGALDNIADLDDTDIDGETNFVIEIAEGTYSENLEILQEENKNITVKAADGATVTMTGTITIDGGNRKDGTETLTIQGFTFETNENTYDFIKALSVSSITGESNSYGYSHNVTIKDCTFEATSESDGSAVVGIRVSNMSTEDHFNYTIENCTMKNGHSFIQATAVKDLVIESCYVYSKNGINGSNNMTITDCTIDTIGYSVRTQQAAVGSLTITNSTLISDNDKDDAVIILRNTDVATVTIFNTSIVGDLGLAISNTQIDVDNTITASYNYWGTDEPDFTGTTLVNDGHTNNSYYPYYSTDTKTTLVYLDEETGTKESVAVETVVSDALDAVLSDTTDAAAIAAAIEIITAVDADFIAEDEDLLEALNTLDAALIENTAGSIEVSTDITPINEDAVITTEDIDADDLITPAGDDVCAEAQGLAVSIIGNNDISNSNSVTVGLTTNQIAASAIDTIDPDTEEVTETTIVVTYEITPFVQYGEDGTATAVETITNPVTFKLYLPAIFNNTNCVSISHDGGEAEIYTIYQDSGEDYSYAILTVTHFSEFVVTYEEMVSTSSSGSTNTGTIIYPDETSTSTTTTTDDDVEEETVTTVGGFNDVFEDDYYADAVEWAVENDITSGMTTTTFVPNNDCTREQVMTFLWRAMGEPDVELSNGFSDVVDGSYYADAVAWAIENGITNGMSDDLFGTGETATRGQIVTFLYRLAGEPEMAGDCDFTDVSTDGYYYAAVLWAVENGITDGMGDGTFAPDSPCTRAQIVTFLYRYFG